MSLTEELKSLAFSIGFDLFGVANPNAFKQFPKVKGRFAREMVFPHPTEILPKCKAVVVVGLEASDDILNAVVQRHNLRAQFYHEIIHNRLYKISEALTDNGYVAKATDSISLKRAAIIAGLGYMCKNTQVATPEYGSNVRWGALLTTCDLEHNAPHDPFDAALCLECNACVEACPADAIGDYTLDFSKCLVPALDLASPESLHFKKARDIQAIYGTQSHRECNICQKVCPLNIS